MDLQHSTLAMSCRIPTKPDTGLAAFTAPVHPVQPSARWVFTRIHQKARAETHSKIASFPSHRQDIVMPTHILPAGDQLSDGPTVKIQRTRSHLAHNHHRRTTSPSTPCASPPASAEVLHSQSPTLASGSRSWAPTGPPSCNAAAPSTTRTRPKPNSKPFATYDNAQSAQSLVFLCLMTTIRTPRFTARGSGQRGRRQLPPGPRRGQRRGPQRWQHRHAPLPRGQRGRIRFCGARARPLGRRAPRTRSRRVVLRRGQRRLEPRAPCAALCLPRCARRQGAEAGCMAHPRSRRSRGVWVWGRCRHPQQGMLSCMLPMMMKPVHLLYVL